MDSYCTTKRPYLQLTSSHYNEPTRGPRDSDTEYDQPLDTLANVRIDFQIPSIIQQNHREPMAAEVRVDSVIVCIYLEHHAVTSSRQLLSVNFGHATHVHQL